MACVLAEPNTGRAWVAGPVGIDLIDGEKGTVVARYGTESGLPSANVTALVYDKSGRLWAGTKDGIAVFDGRGFTTYFGADGVPGSVNPNAAFCDRDGNLWFGATDGFVRFKPDEITTNARKPEIVLTAFEVNGASRLDFPQYAESVTLKHDENSVTMEFAALDFTQPERNRYRYRLEGLEEEWREAGARRTAGYTNLDDGDYTFRVQACNNHGVWNEAALIKIKILPPWWETGWAYALQIGLFLVLFMLSYYFGKTSKRRVLGNAMFLVGVLVLFEYFLVLAENYIDPLTGNIVWVKVALNLLLAGVFHPLERFSVRAQDRIMGRMSGMFKRVE